jgi:hypothetical protein
MALERNDTDDRLIRIEQMIEEFREARQRRLVRRALRFWRKAKALQQIVDLEVEPERIR